MTENVTIQGVTMTRAAAENVLETGTNVTADVEAARCLQSSWQEECLDGADEDRLQGWRDYIDAVMAAAESPVSR